MNDFNQDHWQEPGSCEPRALRRAFGAFATGVTIVATRLESGEVRGFTANSFSSVSMDPPLISVCLGKFSASLEEFQRAGCYSVSILNDTQRDLSNAFASRDADVKIAAAQRLSLDAEAPYVGDGLATFICSQHAAIDAGDHVILIGRITRFATGEGAPLGFFRGGYVGLGPDIEGLEKMPTTVTVGGLLGSNGKVLLLKDRDALRWSLPTVTLRHGERHAHAIARAFVPLTGTSVKMSLPYSLFQEANASELTLIFTVEGDVDSTLSTSTDTVEAKLFGIDDAPWTLIDGEMKQSMLQRFLREMSLGRLGMYFDTSDGGSVLAMDALPRDWSEWNGRLAG